MVIHKDIVEALTALEPGLHMMSLPRRLKVQAISSRAVSTKQPQEFSARTLEMSVSCRHGVSGARNARLQADTRTLHRRNPAGEQSPWTGIQNTLAATPCPAYLSSWTKISATTTDSGSGCPFPTMFGWKKCISEWEFSISGAARFGLAGREEQAKTYKRGRPACRHPTRHRQGSEAGIPVPFHSAPRKCHGTHRRKRACAERRGDRSMSMR